MKAPVVVRTITLRVPGTADHIPAVRWKTGVRRLYPEATVRIEYAPIPEHRPYRVTLDTEGGSAEDIATVFRGLCRIYEQIARGPEGAPAGTEDDDAAP